MKKIHTFHDVKMKTAIITGAGGMDGSILSEKLVAKGYKVVGIDRWSPVSISPNLVDIINNPNFTLETGDITEKEFMSRIINEYKPEYFYNMAAISLVPESFKIPHNFFEINTMAVLSILELIRTYSPKTRFYQASTSEQIGDNTKVPQNTESEMLPNSPYAIAKLASYHLVRTYRNAFNIFAVNGMLWNHEGPRRGDMFVTQKIVKKIMNQLFNEDTTSLQLGNLYARRDWGLADDYCDAMIMMMEADESDDYAVNTGESHTIKEFVNEAYREIGINIIWKGEGINEKGYCSDGGLLVESVEKYYRPTEVPYLQGDHSKIKEKLGWEPKTKFEKLVKIMIDAERKKYNE